MGGCSWSAPAVAAELDGLLIPTHEYRPGPVRFGHSEHVDLRHPDGTPRGAAARKRPPVAYFNGRLEDPTDGG